MVDAGESLGKSVAQVVLPGTPLAAKDDLGHRQVLRTPLMQSFPV
jgi:hypothetical protein